MLGLTNHQSNQKPLNQLTSGLMRSPMRKLRYLLA